MPEIQQCAHFPMYLGKTGYYDFALSYLGVDFGLMKYLLLQQSLVISKCLSTILVIFPTISAMAGLALNAWNSSLVIKVNVLEYSVLYCNFRSNRGIYGFHIILVGLLCLMLSSPFLYLLNNRLFIVERRQYHFPGSHSFCDEGRGASSIQYFLIFTPKALVWMIRTHLGMLYIIHQFPFAREELKQEKRAGQDEFLDHSTEQQLLVKFFFFFWQFARVSF